MDLGTQERLARRASKAWLALLALGLGGWWALMLGWAPARPWFVPASTGSGSLAGLFLGDLFLVFLPTLYALRQHDRDLGQARSAAWVVTGGLGYSAAWSVGATLWSHEAPIGPPLMLICAGIQASVAWTMQPAADWFRVSAAGTAAGRVARTLAHTVVFDGLFLVVAPLLIRVGEDQLGVQRFETGLFWPCLAAVVVLNATGFGSGAFMAVIGRGTPLPVDTAAELVVTGPYGHLRNPMAAVGILQGVLLGVGLGSWLTAAYALAGAVLWHLFVRPVEEADLERRFGEPYRQYRANVPLWLPRFRAWRPNSEARPSTAQGAPDR